MPSCKAPGGNIQAILTLPTTFGIGTNISTKLYAVVYSATGSTTVVKLLGPTPVVESLTSKVHLPPAGLFTISPQLP